MPIVAHARRIIKGLLLGRTVLPERFFLGLTGPQTEVAVWLHGMGTPVDVTHRHSMACAVPFTLCIAFDDDKAPSGRELNGLSLKFCERNGGKRVLGEIGLKPTTTVATAGPPLILFEARSTTNHCLPQARIWAHYLLQRYSQWRSGVISDIKLSLLEKRAMDVMFICPRPVVLVSAADELGRNMFPMNVMGDLNNGYFAFALKDSKWPARLVARARNIALSSVPQDRASLAYQIAANHNKQTIDWYQLPFATKTSEEFKIPIPDFAQRVREMVVEEVHRLGSHTFFLARIVRDDVLSEGVEMFVTHGFYQAWRLRTRGAELENSMAEHSRVKVNHTPPVPKTSA